MKLRNTAIALGVGAATAASLSLLKVNKDLIVGTTAVVVGTGLIVSLRDKNNLKTKERNYEYFFNRAQDKFELKDYEGAVLDYNKALELSPTEICLVYSMRGNAKRNLNDFDGAISDQNKVLDFNPLYADGYFNRGIAKYQKGDFDGAIEDYTQVININSKDSDALYNRANIKKEIEDMRGACEDWRKGAELGDEDAKRSVQRYCE